MNFTWFASAYDTDDVPYRLLTLLQIVGVLILAAGIPRMFDERDGGVVTLGYLVMRVGLVSQWLRAAAGHPEGRRTCRRYAAGISVCMVGWLLLLLVPVAPAGRRVRGDDRGRAVGADLGRADGRHAVAPRPHRRALRAVHPDRAGRVAAVRHRGVPVGARRRRGRPSALPGRRRRGAHRVLHVVDLLRQAVRGAAAPRTTSRLPLGLRALPDLRLDRRGRRRPRGRASRSRPATPSCRRWSPGPPSPCRWRSTCSRPGCCSCCRTASGWPAPSVYPAAAGLVLLATFTAQPVLVTGLRALRPGGGVDHPVEPAAPRLATRRPTDAARRTAASRGPVRGPLASCPR